MPDYERALDVMRVHIADVTGGAVEKARAEGYVSGKSQARKELLGIAIFIAAVAVLCMVCVL